MLVLTDDLSTNLVRYMPHVLAMERSGVGFANYIVANTLCCPSRASLLTGEYPHDTGIFENIPKYDGGFQRFRASGQEEDTVATALQSAGYRTAMLGKYLNGYAPAQAGTSRSYVPPGWSEWDVTGDRGYQEYGYALTRNHGSRHYGYARSDYLTSVLERRASAFITASARARQPFFLNLATYTPHHPAVPAPADIGRFPRVRAPRTRAFNRLPTHPPGWLRGRPPLSPANIRRLNSVFRERVQCVKSIDRLIGDLQRALRRNGVARKTVFVFTSDNGLHLGEHRLFPGGKLSPYDSDIRVPLVMTGPGIVAGRRVQSAVQNIDLAPTFEALAGASGIDADASVDGRNLAPLLHGRGRPSWPTLALVEQHREPRDPRDPDYAGPGSGFPPNYQAIRSSTFTYVKYSTGFQEYYNRKRDPAELHNIAGRLTRHRLAVLRHELAALVHCHGARQCGAARHVPPHR